MNTPEILLERWNALQTRVQAACKRSGRNPDEILLLPVSKGMSTASIRDIQAAVGCPFFGESKVQEVQQKIRTLGAAAPKWHLVGHLQSNKTQLALTLFDTIQSVHSVALAQVLQKHTAKVELKAPVDVYVQVNIAREEQKYGLSLDQVAKAFEILMKTEGLNPVGVMTLAPYVEDPESVRWVFEQARDVRDDLQEQFGLEEKLLLSMGMSRDFEVAIEEGADVIRIGSALFGERVKP